MGIRKAAFPSMSGGGASVAPEFTTNPTMLMIPFAGGQVGLFDWVTDVPATGLVYDWKANGTTFSTAAMPFLTTAHEGMTITCTAAPYNGAGNGAAVTITGAHTVGLSSLSIDAETNATTTVSRTFNPSDVDTSANTIAGIGTGFDFVSDYEWTTVYFGTTGALPSPLTINTPYLVKKTGTGVYVYKYATDADTANLPGYITGEKVPYGTFAQFDIRLDLTTQGSGVHTMYTNPLAETVADVSGNGSSYAKTLYNSMLEVRTDAFGKKYFWQPGPVGVKRGQISEPFYGKLGFPANTGLAAGNKRAGASNLSWVELGAPMHTNYVGQLRNIVIPADINTTSDEITMLAAHGMTTGDEVLWGAFTGSTLPAGSTAGTLYARSLSAAIFSLHPTQADANANTNKVNFTNAGTGFFYVVAKKRVQHQVRRMIFDLNQNGNDHTFSPQTSILTGNKIDFTNVAFNIGLWFHAFPQYNGDLSRDQILPASKIGDNWTKLKAYLFISSGSAGWKRQDTNAPMTSGVYWVTKSPGDNFFRLHDSEVNADANIGVLTSLATCIKYVTTNSGEDGKGIGEGILYLEDKTIIRPFDDGIALTGNPWVLSDASDTTSRVTILSVNFGGNGTNRTWYGGVNSTTNLYNAAVTNTAIGTGVVIAGSANSNIVLGNAAEPHIPGEGRVRKLLAVQGDNNTTHLARLVATNEFMQRII